MNERFLRDFFGMKKAEEAKAPAQPAPAPPAPFVPEPTVTWSVKLRDGSIHEVRAVFWNTEAGGNLVLRRHTGTLYGQRHGPAVAIFAAGLWQSCTLIPETPAS